MTMFSGRHSVRTRLTAAYVIVTAVFLAGFGVAMYAILLRDLQLRIDASLMASAQAFAQAVAHEITGDEALSPVEEILIEEADEMTTSDRQLVVFRADGRLVPAHDTRPKFRMPVNDVRDLITQRRSEEPQFLSVNARSDEALRILVVPLKLRGGDYFIAIARRTDDQMELLEGLQLTLLIGVPLWVACAGCLGYWLVRKTLQPVVMMSSEAAAISTADLNRRLLVHNPYDELGHLAVTFNALLDRLTAVLEQQRRFMADASHELRTPLAIVRGEAEVALSKEDRPASDLRESLGVIANESLLLSSIIDDLFLLARADAGEKVVSPTVFYLDELIAEAIRSLRSLALKKSISLQSRLRPGSVIEADERLVFRLLLNVIENAIKYTPPQGSVDVTLQEELNQYEVTVNDTGGGISEENRSLVFDRFYRVRRGPSAEGAGLGLPIARTIAEMHGGHIDIDANHGCGSTFRIVLAKRLSEMNLWRR